MLVAVRRTIHARLLNSLFGVDYGCFSATLRRALCPQLLPNQLDGRSAVIEFSVVSLHRR